MDFISSVLLSFGGGVSLVLALSAWLGNLWAKRLLSNENNNSLKELSEIKYQQNLKVQETVSIMNQELELFKNRKNEAIESHKFAYSAYMSAHSEYVKNRISANEQLWKYIIEIRVLIPSPLYMLDIIKIDNPIEATKGVQDKERICKDFDDAQSIFYSNSECMKAQSLLPFLDEKVFRLYILYKSLCSRFVWYGVLIYHNSCELEVWYKDMRITPAIDELSKEIIGTEQYLKRGSIHSYLDYVENMLSNEIRNSMNGQNLGEEAAISSSRLVDVVANLSEKNTSA
ncbi:hypothetical protein [Psychromonas aquimarina]|uniref:hypothetical protein n=1 Tax=Psychromonas aquimarina TaxID=444919 RepID=UPI00040C12C7|nr:hypothetical protein [Psychromonas aquimarina]